MFDQLMRMLRAPQPERVPDLRLSVAVLLMEAARQDDQFDSHERAVIAQFEQYIKLNKKIPPEVLVSVNQIEEPAKLADTIA